MVKLIPGTTTEGMIHHVKGCMGDVVPDIVLLHCGFKLFKKRQKKSSENRTEHIEAGRRGI